MLKWMGEDMKGSLGPTQRMTGKKGRLREEETVFPREEHKSWLFKKFSPENIHRNKDIQTRQVVFMYLVMCVLVCTTCICYIYIHTY